MTSQTEKMRGHTMCAVDVSPEVVDAGADLTLEAKVSCSPPCDLRGHALLVKHHAGADPRRVELTEFDGVTNRTGDFINREFGIYDHTGAQVGRSALSGGRWPGTTGLHVAEVELEAPAREGLYTWNVSSAESDAGIPHTEGSISFGVQVVSHPECRVTVEAVDKDSQMPLSGARVVMHPYKAITDEHGVAEVLVAKGTYKLFVSQTHYMTFGVPVDVTADMKTRAELELEPVPERN